MSCREKCFKERVDEEKVVVQSAYVDGLNKVTATVCVLNIAYEKDIVVRYTNNNWLTVKSLLNTP